MKTSYIQLVPVIGFICFILSASTPLSAQRPGPDQFDISGIKLGHPGGPGLKKEIEALPEGYKCLDLKFSYKYDTAPPSPLQPVDEFRSSQEAHSRSVMQMRSRESTLMRLKYVENEKEEVRGYSCFAPRALSSPYTIDFKNNEGIIRAITHHLFFLFDEDSNKVWFMSKREVFLDDNKKPTDETFLEAIYSKYGRTTGGNCWAFDKTGEKLNCSFNAIIDTPITSFTTIDDRSGGPRSSLSVASILGHSVAIPDIFESGHRASGYLKVVGSRGDTVGSYTLTFIDEGARFDRHEAAKKAEAERTVAAPTF